MKITVDPILYPRRGSPCKPGNVYQHPWGRPFFKIVMDVVAREGNRPWNNVIFLHIDALGKINGCSRAPTAYVENHNDLVGRVEKMPDMKIKWNRAVTVKMAKE